MNYRIILFVLVLGLGCGAYAEEVKRTGKIEGFNPVNTERWVEIHRENSGILYYDKTTVRKEIIPHIRIPGEGPPVKYSLWVKELNRERKMSEPSSVTVSCQTRERIPPESVQEKLYTYFCLSSDAQNTVYIDPSIEQVNQQRMQEAQNQALRNKQLEEARRNAAMQNALNTGLNYLRIVPGLRGY